ncbi:MAG: cell wall-binding repeat-containing protein [Bacilli bacterium]
MTLIFSLFLTIALLFGCGNNEDKDDNMNHDMDEMDHEKMNQSDDKQGDSGNESVNVTAPSTMNPNVISRLKQLNTKNTTRLNTDDPIEMSVLVSQTIWPATHKENQPNAVILVPLNNWQIALASTDLIHHPNNGPVLFIENDRIPDAVIDEINRLNPPGNMNDTQVMVMGDVESAVLDALKEYKIEHIKGADAATFAKDVDQFYADVAKELPQSVIIGSLENSAMLFTLPAANWIAHMPEPILYVSKDGIPEPTKEALVKRKDNATMYILGPEAVVSKEIEEELKEFGTVIRISGANPVDNSIAFAQYRDEKTKFGWGIIDPGHGVSFVSTLSPELAVAGAPFAHLGKHAPLIWVEDGKLSDATYKFFEKIKPTFTDMPTVGPYNQGFILGSDKLIPYVTQGIIDDSLEIVKTGGGVHGGGH